MFSERFVATGRVAAIAATAAGAGLLVVEAGYAAVVGGAVMAALAITVTWPRRTRAPAATSTRQALLTTLLVLYLVPLLMLGRTFAVVGSNPVYVPDVLLAVASLLMLPKLRLRPLRPMPLLCIAVALLTLHSVYVGYQHGYPAATKGLVLVLYPLLAIIIAGWICGFAHFHYVLSVLARYVLPLVTVGLAIVTAANASLIAASYGLYLGIAVAFAVTPDIPGRRILRLSSLVGLILLIGLHAERGPALTILLAALSAWLAGTPLRSRAATTGTAIAGLAAIACAALILSLAIVPATQIPVIGGLSARITATNTSVNPSAANNVTLRKAIWSYALHTTYAENPLLGVGAYHPIELTYRGNDLQEDPATGVHNSFVGYIFYAGYPAGFLVALVFALGLWRVWRIRALDTYAPALFGALVAVIATALTNVALETTYIGGPSWLVLAAVFGLAGSHSRLSHRQQSSTTDARASTLRRFATEADPPRLS